MEHDGRFNQQGINQFHGVSENWHTPQNIPKQHFNRKNDNQPWD
jgi:hypothetical protein